MIDIRMTNGIRIQQRNLTYRNLKSLIEKLEGTMLNVTGMNRFYYLRNFHDMRCKYERVLSIIHQQLNREPQEDEVFIVMSNK